MRCKAPFTFALALSVGCTPKEDPRTPAMLNGVWERYDASETGVHRFVRIDPRGAGGAHVTVTGNRTDSTHFDKWWVVQDTAGAGLVAFCTGTSNSLGQNDCSLLKAVRDTMTLSKLTYAGPQDLRFARSSEAALNTAGGVKSGR